MPNPVITSAATADFAEKATGTVYTVTANADAGKTLTYTLSGADANRFNIDSNGVVTFKAVPNFEVPTDNGADNIYNIEVIADDGALTGTKAVAITVTNVNDAPTITSPATATFAENATGTVYTVTATDADASTTLAYSLSGADANLFNINNGVVTFKAAPNFEAPSDRGQDNIYNINVIADDGALTGTKAVAITVTNVNDAPTITSAATATFAENGTGTVYTVTANTDPGKTLTYSLAGADKELFNINNGVVTFKTVPNFEAAGDIGANNVYDIKVTASDGTSTDTKDVAITVTNVNETAPIINSDATAEFAENGTGTVYTVTTTGAEAGTTLIYSLSGDDAGLFNINSSNGLVRFKTAPNFEAPADNGKDNSYNINVTASDGTLTDAQAVVIKVTNVNEAPTITSAATVNFAENGTGTVYTVTADADPGETLTYSLSGDDVGLFNIDSNGVVTFKTAPNFELPTDKGANNIYNINVIASDGRLTDTQAVAINVTNVNETAPIINSAATANFAENGTGTVYTVTTTGAEEDTTLTYSLSGDDKELFNIDSNGVVTFKDAPNFEVPTDSGADKVYNIDVKVSDGALTNPLTDTKAVAITVTNVNEAPVITSAATANFAENGTGTVYTVTATDADAGTTLTYSLSGDDAGLFNINRSNGLVTFKTAPNFELPTDNGANNVYDINVIASDGTLNTPQAVAITVTNVNETAPVITSAATATFAENGTGTVYTVTATGAEAGTTFTYSLSGADAGLFNINNGVVTFKTPPNFQAPSDTGKDNVYDIKVTASDGALTNPLTVTKDVAITVTNNEAPTDLTLSPSTIDEGQTLNASFSSTDPDTGDTFTYSLVSGDGDTDNDSFTIDGNQLTLNTGVFDYETKSRYSIRVKTTDQDGSSFVKELTINVNDINKPTDLSLTSNTLTENQLIGTVVGSFTSTDPDIDTGKTFTYSLVPGVGDTDNNSFEIDGDQLKTKKVFNFETDRKTYNINVKTTDQNGKEFVKQLTIDLGNEAPVITSAATANFVENGTGTVYTVTATDPGTATLTYSLSGADANLFNINNGVVTFKTAPNFEAPSDSGANNIYDLNVIASDGTSDTPLAIAINVTNDVTEKDERKFGERLEVKLTGYNSKLNSELGVFFVDNADGTIITTGTGGRSIAPGTAGYTDEALKRGQVIFSLLGTGNSPVGFNQINLSRVLELNSNTILRYYLVKDGSTDSVINKTTPQSNVLFNADANGFENLRVTTNRYNTFSAPGTGVQNKPQGTTGQKELLDLAGINGPVTAEFVVNREAAYNNFVGFYKVVNENGGIDNNGDGIADVLPTAAAYAQEALKARVTDIALTVNNNGTATFKSTLQGGSIYAPFIITNGGTPDYYDNTNSRIYFAFGAANSDKVNSLNTDHVRLLGNNTFGFEDLAGGGDNDFNDVIVKVNLLV